MSTVKTNNLQLGQSLTATNNFSWYQPSSPDGTVRLGVGNAGATTADVIKVNSSGIASTTITAANGNTVEATSGPTSTQLAGQRNKIINGAMMIDQRKAGAAISFASGPASTYTLDRWGFGYSQNSKITAQQNQGSVTPPAGFSNYLGFTSSSAYSLGASDYFILTQPIEGFNVSDLAWGTANAKSVTLSFWVYSSLTGTFGGSLRNNSVTRSYPFSYSVNSANTWTQVSVTIPGDTTGTWLTTNGIGITVGFTLGSGSNFLGTSGAWGNANYHGPTGATSVVGTNGATFYITGVQLEKGATATPFENRLYGTELALCQRYYEQWVSSNNYVGGGVGMAYGASGARIQLQYQVPKRAAPSCAASGRIDWADSVGNFTQTAFSFDAPNQNNVLLYGSVTGTTTAGRAMQAYGPLAVPFTVSFSAEL